MGFYFNFFFIIHDRQYKAFCFKENIIVLKDVCRSKNSHESLRGLTSRGTKSCFKIDGPSENKKKEEDQ